MVLWNPALLQEANTIVLIMGNMMLFPRFPDEEFHRTNGAYSSGPTVPVPNADQRTQVVREDGKNYACAYDTANQLTNVVRTADNARVLSARYDALGRRVEAIRADGTVDRYIYFPGSFLVLAVLDGSNAVKEIYTRGPDFSSSLDGAGGIGGILACTYAFGETYYSHADIMGNVIALTDASGSVAATFRYTPFGEVLARTGPFTPRYQFSTKEFSSRTGLNYYGYRYYAPRLGRWMTRDPIEEDGGANLYNYLGNASLNNWDGLGLRGLPPPSPPSSIGGLVNLFCTIVNGIWTCKNNYNYDTYNARAVENCQNARQLWNAENRDNLSCACTKDGIPTPPRHCCRIEIVGIQSRLSMDAPIEWINGTSTFFSCTTCADAPHYDSPPSLGSPDFDYKYIVYYLDM